MDLAPSVYEHAAAVIGETPWRVSRDLELLFQAHVEAFHLYRHAPVVVGIDIYNLEAEAYGATILEPPGNALPSVSAPLCQTCADIRMLEIFDPLRDGRIPIVLETGKRLKATLTDADIRIPISGPFSLAGNLVGFDSLLCDIIDDPQSVRQALDHLAWGQIAFAREVVSQGMQITLFESGATPPLISPESFAKVVLPVLKHIITEVSSMAGHHVPCIIGGNTFPILDSILETGAGYVICPSETDQAAFMQQMDAHPEVMVRINTNPAVFATGSPMEVQQEIERVLRIAGSRQKVCIGTGVLPFDTKPDLVLLAKKILRNIGRACQPTGAGDA
jgi:uroporphyrinogen decarboxylase